MKNVLFTALLLPFLAYAQNENALLWKVTQKHNKHVSYLFGTIHSNDSLINTFDKNWWKAFNSCELVAGEVNTTDTNELLASMSSGMMKDSTLSDFYDEQELKRVQNYILEKMDPMAAMVVSMFKPMYILAALMEAPHNDSPYETVMDIRLQSIALEQNKKVIGLESMAEQSASIDVISLSAQAKMLLEYVDSSHEQNNQMDSIETYYSKQDLRKILKLEEGYPSPAGLMTSLLDDRNHRFIQNLLPHLSSSNVFCAVGALHLTGEKGMIALLRKEGFEVKPVHFEFKE